MCVHCKFVKYYYNIIVIVKNQIAFSGITTSIHAATFTMQFVITS